MCHRHPAEQIIVLGQLRGVPGIVREQGVYEENVLVPLPYRLPYDCGHVESVCLSCVESWESDWVVSATAVSLN